MNKTREITLSQIDGTSDGFKINWQQTDKPNSTKSMENANSSDEHFYEILISIIISCESKDEHFYEILISIIIISRTNFKISLIFTPSHRLVMPPFLTARIRLDFDTWHQTTR
jgi:plasmid rolling circle replication initiator protein Rep